MKLQIAPRSSQLTITADASLTRPFEVKFEGAEPIVREHGDIVEIEYSFSGRVRAASSRRGSLTVALNPAHTWDLDLRGGVAGLRADLSGLQLASIAIGGGASDIVIDLPEPDGELPLRIDGGVSRATIRRPGETPVEVEIDGGATGLQLDGVVLGAAGGRIRQRTAHGQGAAVALSVGGGASGLTVESRVAPPH